MIWLGHTATQPRWEASDSMLVEVGYPVIYIALSGISTTPDPAWNSVLE